MRHPFPVIMLLFEKRDAVVGKNKTGITKVRLFTRFQAMHVSDCHPIALEQKTFAYILMLFP
jgi:hypothetical protein